MRYLVLERKGCDGLDGFFIYKNRSGDELNKQQLAYFEENLNQDELFQEIKKQNSNTKDKSMDKSLIFFIEKFDHIVGFLIATFKTHKKTACVDFLEIANDEKNRGYEEKFLEFFEKWCNNVGVTKINATSTSLNKELFESLDYVNGKNYYKKILKGKEK